MHGIKYLLDLLKDKGYFEPTLFENYNENLDEIAVMLFAILGKWH